MINIRKLNLCIDIDGTITDPYYWVDAANKYFRTDITSEDVTQYKINNILGVTSEEYEEFYEKLKFKIHKEEKLRNDSRVNICRLKKNSNIYFVTARDKSLELLTRRYLKDNRIPFDSLYVLGSDYKVNKAKELNCDWFIEDNYDNAIGLSKSGFKVLLMDTNYNRMPLNACITRVYNWKEIYNIISEKQQILSSHKQFYKMAFNNI